MSHERIIAIGFLFLFLKYIYMYYFLSRVFETRNAKGQRASPPMIIVQREKNHTVYHDKYCATTRYDDRLDSRCGKRRQCPYIFIFYRKKKCLVCKHFFDIYRSTRRRRDYKVYDYLNNFVATRTY